MESIWNYRESLITYFKDHKLFESISYFTGQKLEEFPTRAELEAGDQEAPKEI